jgi:hypothetical protein
MYRWRQGNIDKEQTSVSGSAKFTTGTLTFFGPDNTTTNTATIYYVSPGVLNIGGSPYPFDYWLTFTADTGSISATTPADSLAVVGAGTVSTSISGDMLVITGATPTPVVVPVGANPTAEVDGTVVNGAATTFMRSDAAPPLANPFTVATGPQVFQPASGDDALKVVGNLTQDQGVSNGSGIILQGLLGPLFLDFRILDDTVNYDSIGGIQVWATDQGQPTPLWDFSEFWGVLRLDASGAAVTGGLGVTGNATVDGNTTLGTANSDTINVVGRFNSELTPATDDTYDLGRTGHEWQDLYLDGIAYIDGLLVRVSARFEGTSFAVDLGDTGTQFEVSGTSTGASTTVSMGDIDAGGNGTTLVLSDNTETLAFNGVTATFTSAATITGLASLPNGTSASTGLRIGGDVDLYRSAANILRTPDSVTIDNDLVVTDDASIGGAHTGGSTLEVVGGAELFRLIGAIGGSTIQRLFTQSNTASNSTFIVGSRARDSAGAEAIVSSGDSVFGVQGQAYDGSTYRTMGQILWTIDGTPGASDMPGRIAFTTTPDGSATPVTRFALESDGAIFIPEITTTPTAPSAGAAVHVYMKSDKIIYQYNDGGTVRYKYLDLTGTGVTWVQTTVAP